ncbi:Uridine nucleosidase 1 [Elasticomyces elasticus]|nr:Uridine nucleosidase 1 [Elasticomyces elasticus]
MAAVIEKHSGQGKEPVALWLDCDTGHDVRPIVSDAFAILLSSCCPAVRVLGISTVYGNASLDHTTYNTCAILKAIGREDVDVYAGATKPFCRAAAHAPDIHGESGLDGTTCLTAPSVSAKSDKTAIEAMYAALILQPPGTAWLVATGALTNAALLFAVHPDLVNHIAGLSVMGGAIGDGFTDAPMGTVAGEGERIGNWTPWAEFNIYCDPEAAQAVFSNEPLAAKTTLIPLDLTHQMLATREVRHALLYGGRTPSASADAPTPVRKLFQEILLFFAQTYADIFGLTDGPPLHDPLAVAACFVPEIFDDVGGERFAVSVITEGEHGVDTLVRGSSQCGRTVATMLHVGQTGVRIPRTLDSRLLWEMLDRCLSVAEQRSKL